MESTQQKPLKILNASAGSGKTFNLVKEYIQLLLTDKSNTFKFAQIIAMTFTNKAAFEMKSRIIQALDELSFPDKYGKKSDEYALLIGNALGLNPEEIHIRAKIVLQNILHRYEDFHVLTIDKFNLKLIRSFSRDLNLTTDFEIIFNETEVIEKVIDKMMSELDISEQNHLTKIIFEYAKSNIEEGEKWDFRKNLIKFSEIIKNEKYNSIVESLIDKDFSIERLKELKLDLKRKKDYFISECQKVYSLFLNENIESSDLPDGSRTYNAIIQINAIKTVPNNLFTDSFIKKCETLDVPKGKKFPSNLKTALLHLQEIWKKEVGNFKALELYIRNYYNMALLQFMAKQLGTIRKEEQLIRISEFNTLISQLVKNEDAPFIYERLGTRFQNFLLDEFQDTSHLQWLNIVPLVHESISNMNKNLIVGDPKQSIYRFKNGVAEQFIALPTIYNPDLDRDIQRKSDYFQNQGSVSPLEDNWRSAPVIVQFNNHFFELIKKSLSENNQAFYDSIYQNPKAKIEGYVEIISEAKTIENDKKEFDHLLNWIEECEADGFKRGDICLLGERNKECNSWAIFLSEKGYDVVSADSLLVGSDTAVQLTISYLKRRLQPLSENEKRKFAEKYFSYSSANSFIDYKSFLNEFTSESTGKKYTRFNDIAFINQNFKSQLDFFMKYENVYDLIQKFFLLMKFDELKNPYLHHLADLAHQYDLNNGPDLKSFVDYYDSEGHQSAVQLPESENAIKIMSIHKSKGLEFPVVILPNMNISNSIQGHSRFLFETNDYILYSGASQNSEIDVIKEFTKIENDLVLTDSLNKCYVALTRPVERLYIYNTFSYKKDSTESDFGAIFNTTLINLNYSEETFKKVEESEKMMIQIGQRCYKQENENFSKESFFIPKNVSDKLWFPDISLQDKENLKEKDNLSDAQRYGNQLHLVLASINFKDEIQTSIENFIKSGFVENKFRDRIILDINDIFNDKAYQSLFTNAVEILSEQDLISGEFTTIRPDKIIIRNAENQKKSGGNSSHTSVVVVDYKTGLPHKKM
ncbi:MAG: UvrD-helicase domain-containing protein [Flavobacteriia bacterium]|nr:UvrD-helicase domain-containing protein [Flavobacteriia bacterium]